MPFGRSDAGLEFVSVYRVSVVQRTRTFSRALPVVSTIICWCSHLPASVAISARNTVNSSQSSGAMPSFRMITAMPSAVCIARRICSQRMNQSHTDPLPRSNGFASPSGLPPSYRKLGTECWRDVIVAGHSRKSSASFGTPAIVSLRDLAAVDHQVLPVEG